MKNLFEQNGLNFQRKIIYKMKENKLALFYRHLVSGHSFQTQFSNDLQGILFRKMRLQNFSLSSCFFNKETDNDIHMTQIKNIKTLSVSKQKKVLFKVKEKDIEVVEKLKKGDIFYPYEDPGSRIKNILLEDIKINCGKIVKWCTGITTRNLEPVYFKRHTDVLIIGGGAIGLSIAHAIKSQFPFGPDITVVDKDNSFPHASTNLGQGIVSFQVPTDEEDFAALKYGAEFFSSFSKRTEMDGKPPFTMSYDPLGTLVLVDNSNVEQVLKINDKLKNYGIFNKVLDKTVLKNKFPWLNVDNVLFGSLGMYCEGMIDPWIFLIGLKAKCLNLGVNFVTAEVIDFGFENNSVVRVVCKLPDETFNSIDFAYCIIAGGVESLNLVNILNESEKFQFKLKLPLEERMRYEYCFYKPDGPGMNSPMIINSEKTYFRREGLTGHYVAGINSIVNNGEKENEPYLIFENKIKPFLMKRMPDFSNIDLVGGWVDFYDFCISNQMGITGPHPDTNRIIFALGFSHLGLQYIPPLGRAIMEYLFYDGYKTVDFEPYHIENLWRKQHLEVDRKKRELLKSLERVSISE